METAIGLVNERLASARKEAGYSQQEVSDLLGAGFSAASLHRWENGGVVPPFDGVAALASLYNVSLDWLAGRTTCLTSHEIEAGKLLVDQGSLERFLSLKSGERLPEDLIGPRLHCVWVVPDVIVSLAETASDALRTRIERKFRELSCGRNS